MNMFKTMANNAYIDVIFLYIFINNQQQQRQITAQQKPDKTKNNDKIAYTSIESITKIYENYYG